MDYNKSKDCFIFDDKKFPSKCITRKKIEKTTNYVIIKCSDFSKDPLYNTIKQPDIGFLGKMIGIKFNYDYVIKNKKTNQILAVSKGSYCDYEEGILNSWLYEMIAIAINAGENRHFDQLYYSYETFLNEYFD